MPIARRLDDGARPSASSAIARRLSRSKRRVTQGEWIMAYIDFAQPLPAAGDGISLPAVAARIKALATGFSAEEWQIVSLARTDGLSSLRDPGA
ncbi:hypothetical protein [Sphingobium sp.]|uniref:hypothetical protein n=2 Tax=Sphingobium sp. TaxID=1912891 RepID=UPI002E232EC6